MLKTLLRILTNLTLPVRDRIRVRGLDQVAVRGRRRILFLPNHPALIDPAILLAKLHKRFEPRPLAIQSQLDRPLLRWLARKLDVRILPDLSESADPAAADGGGQGGLVTGSMWNRDTF